MTRTQGKFVIVAVAADGTRGVYTGRAGQGFVAPKVSEAFVYESLEAARRKATKMNEYTELHGWRFHVPSIQIFAEVQS